MLDVYEVRDAAGRLRLASVFREEAVRWAQGIYRIERGTPPEVTALAREPVDHRRNVA